MEGGNCRPGPSAAGPLCWNSASPPKKKRKVPPDGNKLATGVSDECWSLKADPASKWLNLAFVEAEKSGWSPAHNQPRWKSIGSFCTRGLIKTGAFSLPCLDDTVLQKSLSSAPTTRHVPMVTIPFDPHIVCSILCLMVEIVEEPSQSAATGGDVSSLK